ncbi:MAG TPA: hypothetical protein VI451_15955, partial [Anaerolineales bacterium]|nr:hypothetical protein [Anaerolineales bacterium]
MPIFIIAVFFLAACEPVSRPEQQGTDQKLQLADGKVGQTLVAEYDGLMGVEIFVRAHAASTVRYHLQTGPRGTVLAGGETTLQSGTVPGFVRLSFDPQPHSREISYYFSFETDNPEPVVVRAAPGATYLNGSAYQNDEPLPDAQLAFRLAYHPGWMVWGLFKEGIIWLGMLILFGVVYIPPGWVGLSLLWPGWGEQEGVEKLILSAGVGLVVYPLLLEWTDVFGLRLGALSAWLPLALAWGYLLWKYPIKISPFTFRFPKLDSLTLFLVAGLLFATRFWAIRSLDAPMWGDAFQHTMIAQLLVDNGGLFDSWRPYAELSTFTYHFGFHTHGAVLHWMTGMPLEEAILWAGQILNGLAVLGLYPLANKLGGNRWAGIGAVLVAGFLSSMPMFYVNWGRYTQLTGQVVLVVILFVVRDIFSERRDAWRSCILIGGLMAGLAL